MDARKPLRIARLRGEAPKAPPEVPRVLRVATLKPEAEGQNTSRGAAQCDQCDGRTMEGNWLHSPACSATVVLWDRYDKATPWPCYHQCAPTQLASGRTHFWNCLFWSEHPCDTPF